MVQRRQTKMGRHQKRVMRGKGFLAGKVERAAAPGLKKAALTAVNKAPPKRAKKAALDAEWCCGIKKAWN